MPPHLGGGEKHIFRLLGGEEPVDGLLVGQVEFGVCACDDIVISSAPELADDRRASPCRGVPQRISSIFFPSFYDSFLKIFFKIGAHVFRRTFHRHFLHVGIHHAVHKLFKRRLGRVPSECCPLP